MSTCRCPNNCKSMSTYNLHVTLYWRLLNTLPIFTTDEVLTSTPSAVCHQDSSQMKSDYFLHCIALNHHHHQHHPLISSWMCFISCFISKQSSAKLFPFVDAIRSVVFLIVIESKLSALMDLLCFITGSYPSIALFLSLGQAKLGIKETCLTRTICNAILFSRSPFVEFSKFIRFVKWYFLLTNKKNYSSETKIINVNLNTLLSSVGSMPI